MTKNILDLVSVLCGELKTVAESNSNISEMRKYSVIIENLAKLFGGGAAIYVVYERVCNVAYGIQCEEFYKIPSEYFYRNVDTELFRLLIFLLLFWWVLNIPKYINTNTVSSKAVVLEKVVYGVVFGGLVAYINLFNFLSLVMQFNCNNVIASVGCICVLLVGILMFHGLTIPSLEQIKIIKIACISFIIFQCGLLCIGFTRIFFQNIEDKRKYEFVHVENKEYVVLSKKDDVALVVPFSEEYHDSRKVIIFHNDEYLFLNGRQGIFRFEHLDCEPQMRVK